MGVYVDYKTCTLIQIIFFKFPQFIKYLKLKEHIKHITELTTNKSSNDIRIYLEAISK